jgi:hypothetical protein
MKTVTEAVDAVITHGTGAREVLDAARRARELHARYCALLEEVTANPYVIMLVAGLADVTADDDEEGRAVVMQAVTTAFLNRFMVGVEYAKVDLEDVYGDDPNGDGSGH